MKVHANRLKDLQNQCDEKDELSQELCEQCAEQIDYDKEEIQRLQKSLQNTRDEIDNLISRSNFNTTLIISTTSFKTLLSIFSFTRSELSNISRIYILTQSFRNLDRLLKLILFKESRP